MSTYIVYGITDCPACLRACADLMEADIEYVFVEMDFSKTYREYIKNRHQWPTFPIIIRQSYNTTLRIGGYDQLKEYMKNPGSLT
jgi:glutaredoxin